jgi:hypothetical protein
MAVPRGNSAYAGSRRRRAHQNEKNAAQPSRPGGSIKALDDPLRLLHAGAITLAARARDLHPALATEDAG